VFPIN